MNNDALALDELSSHLDLSKPQRILHYLYIPNVSDAMDVASELKRLGFQTKHTVGADGINWLVRAWHEIVATPELISSLRASMEALVVPFNGEYDGWEVDLRKNSACN